MQTSNIIEFPVLRANPSTDFAIRALETIDAHIAEETRKMKALEAELAVALQELEEINDALELRRCQP